MNYTKDKKKRKTTLLFVLEKSACLKKVQKGKRRKVGRFIHKCQKKWK